MEVAQNTTLGVLSQVLTALTGCAGWPDLRTAIPEHLRASTIGDLGSGSRRQLFPVDTFSRGTVLGAPF